MPPRFRTVGESSDVRNHRESADQVPNSGLPGSGRARSTSLFGSLHWKRLLRGRKSRSHPTRPSTVAADIPELAIVSCELFDRVAARKLALGRVHPSHQRRRKHLLTGLLRCGGCGSGLTVRTTHRDGRKRVACARQHESRDCPAPHSFMLPTIERAVLSGLQTELRKPDMLTEFTRAYREERKRLAATTGASRQSLEREAADTQRKLDRVITCIVEGHGDPAVLGPQSTALHRQLERIRSELATLEETPTVIELHAPGLARYLAYVDDLAGQLCGDAQAVQSKAAEAIRGLIETVTVWPGRSARHGARENYRAAGRAPERSGLCGYRWSG